MHWAARRRPRRRRCGSQNAPRTPGSSRRSHRSRDGSRHAACSALPVGALRARRWPVSMFTRSKSTAGTGPSTAAAHARPPRRSRCRSAFQASRHHLLALGRRSTMRLRAMGRNRPLPSRSCRTTSATSSRRLSAPTSRTARSRSGPDRAPRGDLDLSSALAGVNAPMQEQPAPRAATAASALP